MQPQGAEPLHPLPLPELPFQKVGTDLFVWDKEIYLLVIDYYSCFIEIAQLTGPVSVSLPSPNDVLLTTTLNYSSPGKDVTTGDEDRNELRVMTNSPPIPAAPSPAPALTMFSATLRSRPRYFCRQQYS